MGLAYPSVQCRHQLRVAAAKYGALGAFEGLLTLGETSVACQQCEARKRSQRDLLILLCRFALDQGAPQCVQSL
jgi:CO dehydrogenase/acetyl-CoA synthase alpha subunit